MFAVGSRARFALTRSPRDVCCVTSRLNRRSLAKNSLVVLWQVSCRRRYWLYPFPAAQPPQPSNYPRGLQRFGFAQLPASLGREGKGRHLAPRGTRKYSDALQSLQLQSCRFAVALCEDPKRTIHTRGDANTEPQRSGPTRSQPQRTSRFAYDRAVMRKKGLDEPRGNFCGTVLGLFRCPRSSSTDRVSKSIGAPLAMI